MYKRTYYVSTLYGSPGRGGLLGDPQGVEVVGKGFCTSVTALRMTDAYGAGTRKGCHTAVPATPLLDRMSEPDFFYRY